MKAEKNRQSRPATSPTDLHLWQITAIQDIFWIGLTVSLLWLGYYLRTIFTPLLIGLVLAYLFHPLIQYAEDRWRLPRPITIISLLTFLLVAGFAVVAWLGPLVLEQVITLLQKMPGYIQSLSDRYDIQLGSLTNQLDAAAKQAQQDPISILQTVFTGTSEAFGFIGTVIGATTYLLVSLALIPVYFFFLAWSFPALLQQADKYLPTSQRQHILEIAKRMDVAVGAFFRGRLIIAVLMAAMFAIGWLLAGVPYWFLLGIGTGVLSIIPYAAGAGWIIAVVLKYLDMTTNANAAGFDWIGVFVWPSLIYGVVQLVEGWLLTPWIQSNSTNLSPITVLIVVFVGGAVAGLYGLILAIPVAACVKILAVEVLLPRLQKWAAIS